MIIRYLGSLVYDAVILLVLFITFTSIILSFRQGQAIPPYTYWYQLALLTIVLIYYVLSIKYGEQTLGMRAWRFKLKSMTSSRLSNKQIFLRMLFFMPAVVTSFFCFKYTYTLLNQWTKTTLILL